MVSLRRSTTPWHVIAVHRMISVVSVYVSRFSNDLMMRGNLMQYGSSVCQIIFKKALYGMTQKAVHDVALKTVWKADDVHKTAAASQPGNAGVFRNSG